LSLPIAVVREKDWQQLVYDTARRLGWLAYHPWRSDHSAAGYPDLTMVRGDRLIFAELKRQDKNPTPKQQEWLNALTATGRCEVYVWRPDDWDAVLEILQMQSLPVYDDVSGVRIK